MTVNALRGRNLRALLLAATAALLAIIFAGAAAATAQAGVMAQFNRVTYSYSSTLSTSQEAGRYQVMVMQSTDHQQAAALKAANPSLKIFMYQDVMLSNTTDPTGWTTCTPYTSDNSSHPSWFLTDQNGNRVIDKTYTNDFLMNVGDPSYQQACVAHAISLAKQYGFDGVYFDDVTAWVGWGLPSGASLPQYPSMSSWQTAMYSLISYAAPQIHAQGLPVIANIAGSWSTPGLWSKWTTPLDGSEEESFSDTAVPSAWSAQLANAAWSAANGKYEIAHSHNNNETSNTYGLATMLLVGQGLASYSTANANYSSAENWYPEYTTAQSLGTPNGAYTTLSNGVDQRTFSGGIVLINPTGSSQSVSLGGTYSGSGLTNVSSVTMAAKSGLVLQGSGSGSGGTGSGKATAPVNTGAPTVSGSAWVNQTLTASPGTWSGSPAPTYTYQWDRCTSSTSCAAISGATASTYKVQSADVGYYLAVLVKATNSAGSPTARSAITTVVPTPTFTLTGSPTSITVTHGTTASYKLSVAAKYGFAGAVSLKVTGLPSGATAKFSASTTSTSATMAISTNGSSIGTRTLTVTGTGGGQTKSIKLTLIVK